MTRPRIAIPMPHGVDLEYAERAIPQYERAVEMAGGHPVRIPLDLPEDAVRKMIEECEAVLLPGSKADLDPARFRAPRSAQTADTDVRREAVDNLLLDDAYLWHKPVLGVCYGLQSLNVYRGGSLIQHIPDFLPEETRDKANHEAGRAVTVAHDVEIESESMLRKVVCGDSRPWLSGRAQLGGELQRKDGNGLGSRLVLPVNSSHHQSADAVGKDLRIVARCPVDGIIEALEGTSPDHFVLAVQWHPERSIDDEASRSIFQALIKAIQSSK